MIRAQRAQCSGVELARLLQSYRSGDLICVESDSNCQGVFRAQYMSAAFHDSFERLNIDGCAFEFAKENLLQCSFKRKWIIRAEEGSTTPASARNLGGKTQSCFA